MGRSLRDDAAADEILRSAVVFLASARSLLRLTVMALVLRGLMADVPVPLETLPRTAGSDATLLPFTAAGIRVCDNAEICRGGCG